MSLSTNYLKYGRHLSRLHRRRSAHVPMSNIANHDNHEKINSWFVFFFPVSVRGSAWGPSGNRSSAVREIACVNYFGSVHQKINPLDSQSKFQTFTLFTGCHIGRPRRPSNMAQVQVQVYYFTLFTEKLINIVHRNAEIKKKYKQKLAGERQYLTVYS